MNGVLLYNIGKDKLKKIRFLLLKLGLEGRVVSPEEFALPVGVLADTGGISPAPEASEASQESFSGEMLVLCGLSPAQFSGLLNALRQNRCTVALKAVLTETNAAWPSPRLYRELQAEHEALQKVKFKDAGEKNAHSRKKS
jgi:hypothetical protein